MIIQCENCRTEFNLDESLIKESGSKVRCSVCKEMFMAYPPPQDRSEDEIPVPKPRPDYIRRIQRIRPSMAEPEEKPDRDDFLNELDELEGLADILDETDSELDGEAALFEETGNNLLLSTTEGERQLADRPLSDFPSIEHLGESFEKDGEETAKNIAADDEKYGIPRGAEKDRKRNPRRSCFFRSLFSFLSLARRPPLSI